MTTPSSLINTAYRQLLQNVLLDDVSSYSQYVDKYDKKPDHTGIKTGPAVCPEDMI